MAILKFVCVKINENKFLESFVQEIISSTTQKNRNLV